MQQFVFQLLTRSQRITHDNLEAARSRNSSPTPLRGFAPRCPSTSCARRSGYAAHVLSLRAVGSPARQPCRRVANGAVLGRRRARHRLAPRTPREQSHRRGRTRDDRDDLRVAGGSHHAGLHGTVERRAAGWMGAHRRLRASKQRSRHRSPARSRRAQGLCEGALGGWRRSHAARRGQLAASSHHRRSRGTTGRKRRTR